jgi:hypothetical protein
MRTLSKIAALIGALAVVATAGSAYATHAWGDYHWGRTANPLPLELGDNVSSVWDSHLAAASVDWNVSSVLHTTVVKGGTKPQNCRPSSGRAEICSNRYGNTGWLGIAQIWVSGSHITQGIVKLNDTYFNSAPYNTSAWRSLVACQEVGHIFGLGHQDENFSNPPLGTCMDYSNDPVPNQHPNQHDYDMLEEIYAHLDSVNTYSVSSGDGGGNGKGGGKGKPENVGADIDLSDPSQWGSIVREDARGRSSLYERDLGNGKKVFTFVTWADSE